MEKRKLNKSQKAKLKFFIIALTVIIFILSGILLKNSLIKKEHGLLAFIGLAFCVIMSLDCSLSYIWEAPIFFNLVGLKELSKYEKFCELPRIFAVLFMLLGFIPLLVLLPKNKFLVAFIFIQWILFEVIFLYLPERKSEKDRNR